jgi:hypothetical protein
LEEYMTGIEVYYNIVKLLALRGVEVG